MTTVYTSPNSKWHSPLASFLVKKERLTIDFWEVNSAQLDPNFRPLEEWIEEDVPDVVDSKYPKHWRARKYLARAMTYTLFADVLQDESTELFRGKTRDKLQEILAS